MVEYYSAFKKWSPVICDSTDGIGEQYAKWNKPGTGRNAVPSHLHVASKI